MVDCLSMIQRTFVALAVAACGLLALPIGGAMAQTPDPEGPVVVYQNINDGDVLDQMPLSIQLCFAEPVNNKDLDKGGDFLFEVNQPDGTGLGHRDIFQVDGYGVAVQPGNPVGETEGEWTFSYRVTTPDAEHATEGTFKYTVDPAGEPAPRVSPPACVPTGGTATVSPPVTPPPTNATFVPVSGSPAVTNAATPTSAPGTASPIVTRGPEEVDEGDGPDILTLALVTVGITGGAALVALIGYFVRRRVGFDPHKPKGDGGGDHH